MVLARLDTAIVVLNWNGFADTERCLESLMRLEAADFSIIVCDNASTDGSMASLDDWADRRLPALNAVRLAEGRETVALTIIETGANLGYAGGNNVGLRHALAAGFGAFWILNNDCQVMPDALNWLRWRLEDDSTIGICGSTLVYAHDPQRVQALGGGSYSRSKGRGAAICGGQQLGQTIDARAVEARMGFVNGASMLVTRAFLEDVGLMAEDYFLYWEELDWAMRARGRFRLGYAPQSIVRHKVGASIGTQDFGEGSSLSAYYLARNRLKFCWRHSRLSLPFVYADLLREVARKCIAGHYSRARLIARATFGLPITD